MQSVDTEIGRDEQVAGVPVERNVSERLIADVVVEVRLYSRVGVRIVGDLKHMSGCGSGRGRVGVVTRERNIRVIGVGRIHSDAAYESFRRRR